MFPVNLRFAGWRLAACPFEHASEPRMYKKIIDDNMPLARCGAGGRGEVARIRGHRALGGSWLCMDYWRVYV